MDTWTIVCRVWLVVWLLATAWHFALDGIRMPEVAVLFLVIAAMPWIVQWCRGKPFRL